jgi:predicted nucleic acid-binding protein
MLSFDTNILIYAADRTAGERHLVAMKLLSAAASGSAALSEQSIVEFLHVSTRKLKQPLEASARLVRAWLKNFPLMLATNAIIDETLTLLASRSLSVWDAHMLATCSLHRCDALLSEDLSDGAFYGRIRVLNPFNPRNAQTIAEFLEP